MLSQPSDSESEHSYLGSIQPTLNDVLLALTLPPSALALSVWMPKRRRERILEVTKTVTVTELANVHPKLLQNHQHTVSNVEVGSGHPVTLHISQTTDQYEAASSPKGKESSEQLDFTYRNPLINCEDDEDVIETVHTVNEKFIQFPETMVIDVQSKVDRPHSGNNADNIIDISFDTSRTQLSKTSGNKKAHLSAYFRPSRSLDVLLLSPTDTGFYTSPNRSGLVDGSESDGSMIIHTDDERRLDSGVSSVTGIRIRGNKAFGERANRLVPVSSDDDDLIYLPSMPTTSSTLPRSSRKRTRGGRRYIVTSLTKSQSNPSIYQDASDGDSTGNRIKNSVSHGEISRTFVNGQDESTNRSHLYIKNSCKPSHSYTVTAVTETVHQDVPTDSERDLSIHKITVDLELDRLQQSGSHLNEIIRIENVYQNDISHLPPRMSSTPLSTLEKKRSHQINHGVKVITSSQGVEVHVSNTEESSGAPRARQAVSPIIVVNQNRSRKGSADNITSTPRDNKRKSTVTDIDWFAAFNMKEPLTPRSPRSPLPIDALRECERYVLENGNLSKRIPLAHIEVDEIFKCVNDNSTTVNLCNCSACCLSKIPDEELKKMLKEKMEATRCKTYVYPDDRELPMKLIDSSLPPSSITVDELFTKKSNLTPNQNPDGRNISNDLNVHVNDISLDDVFAGTSKEPSKKQSIDFDKYIQRGREQKEASAGGFNSTVTRTETVEVHKRKSSIPDADVSVDDLFSQTTPRSPTVRASDSPEPTVEKEVEIPTDDKLRDTIRTTDLDISLDDVFAGTSKEPSKKQSIDFDKYIQRGREQKEASAGGFDKTVTRTETVEVHKRKSSIPDADVSVDDLFSQTTPRSPTVRASDSPQPTVEKEVEIPTDDKLRDTIRTTDLDISLDDVFAGTSKEPSKKQSIDFDKYIQRGREQKEASAGGFNSTVTRTETVEVHKRKSSIPDADVSVDDLFSQTTARSPTVRASDSPEPTVEKEVEIPTDDKLRDTIRTTDLDISLDDVFAGTSKEPSKKQSIDFDKYIQRGREQKEASAGGFNSTVTRTETVEVHKRKSSIPDADVSVDDLFSQTTPRSPTVRASDSPEPTVEKEVEIPTDDKLRDTIRTTDLDISLDDVFAGTSKEPSKKQSIDFDKYIQRGREQKEASAGGFNSTVTRTETVEVHKRKSSIPDADVSVDDLFSQTTPRSPTVRASDSPQPTVEKEVEIPTDDKLRDTIRTTDLDISLDDVFAGTSKEPSKKQSIDFDKYIQRGREQKEASAGGFNSTVTRTETVEVHKRKSSIPDADVSVDDLFSQTTPRSPTVRASDSPEPTVEKEIEIPTDDKLRDTIRTTDLDISLDDVFAGTSKEPSKKQSIDFDKYIQRGREQKEASAGGFNSTVTRTETVEVHKRKSSIPDADVSVDDLFSQTTPRSPTVRASDSPEPTVEKEIEIPTDDKLRDTIRTTDLDISLDDVFAGTSKEPSKKQSIDFDKYIQRGREQKEASAGGFNSTVTRTETVEVHKRKSSIPDADVSVDDLFSQTTPRSPTVRASDSPEPTVEKEVEIPTDDKLRDTIRTTDLDISLDDVFAGTSKEPSKKQSIDFNKYIQRGREQKEASAGGFNSTVTRTETVEVHKRKSSIPDADVSVDDLFSQTTPRSPTVRASDSPEPTVEKEIEIPTDDKLRDTIRTTDLDISLDDVFAGTSKEPSKKQSIDFDKYIQRGREQKEASAGGFNSTVTRTETVEVHKRKSSIPDADVSVDDLFSQTTPRSPTVRASDSPEPTVEKEVEIPTDDKLRDTIRTTDLDISLDDVFAGTSKEPSKKQSIDFDKYIQRGREQKEASAGGFNSTVTRTETVEVHKRKSSIPDADVSVDDLFSQTTPRSPTVRASDSPQPTVEKEVEIPTDDKLRDTIRTTDLDISLDDVFAGTSKEPSKKQSIDFDKYIQRGREQKEASAGGFNSTVTRTETVEVHKRKSSIPDADVSVDDLFSQTTPRSPTVRASDSPEPTVEKEVEIPTDDKLRDTIRTTDLDISLDDVFAGTSKEPSKKQSIDFDKYIQRGREQKEASAGGFNSTVTRTETVEVHKRKSSIPDADVSVDDLFSQTTPRSPTVRASDSPEPTVEKEIEIPTDDKLRDTIRTTDLDISLDDVFAGTSKEPSKKQSIDFDKYIQRGREQKEASAGGFNSTVTRTETVEVHKRKSSIPDADVSVDDLFSQTTPRSPTVRASDSPEPTVEKEIEIPTDDKLRDTIRTTDLDISLDDVFAGTSKEPSKKQSIDFDKYIQRGREQKEASAGGFNSTVTRTETVEVHKRKSSIPDADVSVDDLFSQTTPRSPTVRASDSPEPTVEKEVEIPTDDKLRDTIRTTDLDISLDDVFAGTSKEPSKKQSIDFDKYIQRGREQKEASAGGFNSTVTRTETVEVHKRKSSIPDAEISVDDLFNEVNCVRATNTKLVPKFTSNSVDPGKDAELGIRDSSMDDVCSIREDSLPTPPNSLCDSSEELFIEANMPVENYYSENESDNNDDGSEHRTRSRSVTSMNGKKVFTVTFPEEDVDETKLTATPERPEATRKIRKPAPNVERTSVFDIFNINSADSEEGEKNSSDSKECGTSMSNVLYHEKGLDDTSLVSVSSVSTGKRSVVPRIHSTSLTISLDDLERTESVDHHIIPSKPYEPLEGFPNAVPSRRASRYSIRTDELDENIHFHNYARARTRIISSEFSDFYDDLKSPPHTPIKLKRRSIDFYYEEPMEIPVEEEVDVQDFVDEILNQSLDEAAFLATSQHMSLKKEVLRSTDTSIDRKQSEVDCQVLPDLDANSMETPEQMAEKLFVTSTNRNSLYEAILTCPDAENGQTTKNTREKEEKIETIDLNINLDKKTFISEASVVLKENQTEDYIVRMIYPETPEETIVVQEEYEESDDQSKNTTNVTSNIKHIVEKMAPQQKDDEYLEVEVNSEYFIIHGKYSMIIHKTEALGEMLSKIQTSSLDFTVSPKIRKILRQCLHNKISGNNGTDISSRAFHMLNRADPAYDTLNQMALNRFTQNNPHGNINFCTAENMVCRPLLRNRIQLNLNIMEDHLFQYGPGGGYDDVKDTILGYLKRFMRGVHVQKRDLTLVGSGNTCYDVICHCLFESEDVILTNTPSYARLFIDCSERAGCRVEAVPIDLNNVEIDIKVFEKVLEEQREQGNAVKGIVLINPNNPLGITFPKSQVLALGDWAASNDLNLIVDESFSNSNYGSGESESFLSYQHELKNPSKAVWFWSLSKDFGLPGVKIAVLHTPNQLLKEATAALELIYPVSALAQDFASNLLSDYEWADEFHKTKNYRIGKHYEFVAANLKALNFNFITATSGFYVLVDFGQKMNSRTFEEEDRLWHSLIANGVFMTRGKDMRCTQPGWMRLVFGCDKDQVEEGIRRLHIMFGSTANVIGSINY